MITGSGSASVRAFVAAASLLLVLAAPGFGQQVTGQWDFNDGNLSATVGAAGQYWVAPTTPTRDVQTETTFGTTTSFGIPDIGGVAAKVMKFPQTDKYMAYAMYPEIDANGGGEEVNQYTLIMDVLYPAASMPAGQYNSIFQTNDCNSNDGDIFLKSGSGIGISSNYGGQFLPDTWHRVALAFDLSSSTLAKYIDGVQVGVQTLASGVDGRWSLYTKAENRATLLFADDSSETASGYVNSIQIRNYSMSDTELAALGAASATGIPGGTGVTGQWDFENGNLLPTVGRSLVYFKGCLTSCAENLASETQFGPASSFGLPPINEVDPLVMGFPHTTQCTSYLFPHGAAPNGELGLGLVNQYSLIMDVYFKSADYVPQAAPFDNDWLALYTTYPLNDNDAVLFIHTTNNSLGHFGAYGGTEGSCPPDRWLRIAVVLDNTSNTFTKYVNGVQLATQDGGQELALHTTASTAGQDFLLLFADNDNETKSGYVNSIQVRDYAMTEAEVVALGGPTAAGIGFDDPPPHRRAPDANQDGYVDLADYTEFLGCYTGPNLPISAENDLACKNFDIDDDNDIDQADFGAFQSYFTGNSPCSPNCYYP